MLMLRREYTGITATQPFFWEDLFVLLYHATSRQIEDGYWPQSDFKDNHNITLNQNTKANRVNVEGRSSHESFINLP